MFHRDAIRCVFFLLCRDAIHCVFLIKREVSRPYSLYFPNEYRNAISCDCTLTRLNWDVGISNTYPK